MLGQVTGRPTLKGSKMVKLRKISKTSRIHLQGNFDQVFPLFGPLREKEWAHGWEPQILLSEEENIEEHMVFQTPAHLEGETGHYIWAVSKYDPEQGLIEYTVFAESRLWWITIRCREAPDGESCEAMITYTFVGLDPRGEERNAKALSQMYRHELKDWEHAINHYLITGEMLRHHHETK
jgi:hypothetical protein